MTTRLDSEQVVTACRKLKGLYPHWGDVGAIYGVPRGGIPVALTLGAMTDKIVIDDLDVGDRRDLELGSKIIIADDVYDSGATVRPYVGNFDVLVAFTKKDPEVLPNGVWFGGWVGEHDWVQFPWEEDSGGPEDAVRRLLQYLGRDPDDPALVDTPRRMLGWLTEFQEREGYDFNATTFDGIEYGGMVLVRDLSFTSLCEHHLLPFAGKAAVAYIPNGKGQVIGLSKLARFVQHYAHRTQVQERMTEDIMKGVQDATGAESVAVLVQAEHMCMSFRGPSVPGHTTTTSSAVGAFREDARTREEFMMLALSRR